MVMAVAVGLWHRRPARRRRRHTDRRLGRQRGKVWRPVSSGVAGASPYGEKRRGVGDGSSRRPRDTEGGGLRTADSDAATMGAVTVKRAPRCAARKKRGTTLGHPGKEQKEGKGGVQPRGHGARQRPRARAWSTCGGEDRPAHGREKRPERERERGRGGCQVGLTRWWDPLAEREGGWATVGG
jgi:hypothetical protein